MWGDDSNTCIARLLRVIVHSAAAYTTLEEIVEIVFWFVFFPARINCVSRILRMNTETDTHIQFIFCGGLQVLPLSFIDIVYDRLPHCCFCFMPSYRISHVTSTYVVRRQQRK